MERSQEIVRAAVEKSSNPNQVEPPPTPPKVVQIRPLTRAPGAVLLNAGDGKTILARPAISPTVVRPAQVRVSTPQKSTPSPVVLNINPSMVVAASREQPSVPTVSVSNNGVFRVPTPTSPAATVIVEASGIGGQPSATTQVPASVLEAAKRQIVVKSDPMRPQQVTRFVTMPPHQPPVRIQNLIRPRTVLKVEKPAALPTVPVSSTAINTSSPQRIIVSPNPTPGPQLVLPNQPVAVNQLPELFQRPRPPPVIPPVRLVSHPPNSVVRTILIPGQPSKQVVMTPIMGTPLPQVQLPSEPVPTSMLSGTTFTPPKRPPSAGVVVSTAGTGKLVLREDGSVIRTVDSPVVSQAQPKVVIQVI